MWDGNPIKLDCDDHCTTINVINSLNDLKNQKKENEIMPFGATWMELETLILSEVSQKDKYHMTSHISGI